MLHRIFCAICREFLRLGSKDEWDVCDKHATEPAYED